MKCKKCGKEFKLEDAEEFYSDLDEDEVLFNFTCPRPKCKTQNEIRYSFGEIIK